MTFGEFLNTIVGSALKVGLSALLTQYLIIISDAQQHLFTWEAAQHLGMAFSTAAIPIIINWFNKKDGRYGKNKDVEIVEKDA